MEVLAGARSAERELDLRRLLQRFELLRLDAVIDFDLDEHIGPWHPDSSPSKAHASSIGGVTIEPIE